MIPLQTRHAASLALLPLIIPQGLYVKLRASQMDEAAGDRAGVCGEGPRLKVLILGDSSAAGVGVETQDQALSGQFTRFLANDYQLDWRLFARSGATTHSALQMLDDLGEDQFDIVVTALGVNDAKNGVGYAAWCARLNRLYDRLTDRHGARLICASGMPPIRDFPLLPDPLRWALTRRGEMFDAAHREIAEAYPQVAYLQGPTRLRPEHMAKDGFHPGAPIYAEWGRLAADLVRARWPQAASSQAAARVQ